MLTFKGKEGKGLVNSLINKLPVELHLPGYQYCGPGTKLQKRLERGDPGINKLDAACKDHDIAYSQNKSLEDRHKADYVLENKAWERVKSKDAKFGEKAAAWLVTTGMKTKRKLGMGSKRGSALSFKRVLDKIKMDPTDTTKKGIKKGALSALRAVKKIIKRAGGKHRVKIPRIIPFEAKSGGILPLIPIFAGLSALGALSGGAAGVAKTIIDAKNAKKKLEEQTRHNRAMEEIGKKGSGLYLRKNPKGYGLYLKKQKNYQ